MSESFEVTSPSEIIVSGNITNAACSGNSNGSIAVSVSGGTPGYNYLWSNGETTQNISGLSAGSYTVTVTDANNCTVTSVFSLTEPLPLSCLCNASITNVSCNGGSDGSINAVTTGGTAPYTYSWIRILPSVSGVLATTQTISGLWPERIRLQLLMQTVVHI